MSKAKLFIENIFVYGFGSIISKIIPLAMLPIITRLMPDTFYFGLNDISNTIVSFGSVIVTMGLFDAMFRMFFEKDDIEYKKEVCSTAFFFVLSMSVIMFLFLFTFKAVFSSWMFNSEQYSNLLVISALTILVGSSNSIISAPTRMQNKRKIFLVTNTLAPLLSYGISVPLMICGMYIMALPLAALISSFSMLLIFYLLNKSWFDIKKVKLILVKDMLKIGLPLVSVFIVYWIFNSFDRLIIAKMIGNKAVGIYGIGAKVASISQLIYAAFSGGWAYFVFSTMNNENQVEMISKIFEYLAIISFSATIILTPCAKVLFELLFEGDYVKGHTVFPYLFMAPLLLMLYQTIGNQFILKKKTWPMPIILGFGAIVNIITAVVLIPKIGIEGAAIGTVFGYTSALILSVIVLSKYELVKINKRVGVCAGIAILYFISWRLLIAHNMVLSITLGLLIVILYGYFYRMEINKAICRISHMLKKRTVAIEN